MNMDKARYNPDADQLPPAGRGVVAPSSSPEISPPELGRTRPSAQRPESEHALEEDWEIARNQGIGPLSHAGLITEGPESFVLGDFKILRKLGLGGFGAVYLAEQLSERRRVALKVLARSKAVRPDFVERFLREARNLARLNHENIVRGYALGDEGGWHYFAMEYVDGESLFTWLKRLGRVDVPDALHLTLKVAQALAYAHELNLVHRDIKPENILITRNGEVKVADLGLAKEMDEDMSLTRTGTGFGTPYYMAPEQARNAKHVDHRTDIYSLGTTLYHCLTGRLPFKGDTALELILAKEKDPLTPVRRYNRDVPERVDLIVAKMLARRPTERYQNCNELIADIERLGLAGVSLGFVKEVTAESPETFNEEPASKTHEVEVDVRPAQVEAVKRDEDHWWYVRHRNATGQVVTQLLTTRQIQACLQDVNFDLNAMVCAEPDGDFRPLMSFREFQSSVRRRQHERRRSNVDRRNSGLRRVYNQVEHQLTERERQRREEHARQPRPLAEDVRELAQHEAVQKGLDSIKRWWSSESIGKIRAMTKEEEGRRTLIKYGVIAAAVIGLAIFLRLGYWILNIMLS